MPREIKMPKLSDTMEEGKLNVWRKREGDAVERGEVLLEVETDKADMEYEAYSAGTLARILVREGETVSVGTPIAVLRLESDSDQELKAFLERFDGGGEAARETPAPRQAEAEGPEGEEPERPAAEARRPAAGRARAPERAAPEEPGPPAPPSRESRLAFFFPDPDAVRATPRARVIARERGVDLSEIAGSGPDRAVLVSDVEAYLKALEEATAPQPGDVPITPVAQRIADEMAIDVSRVTGTGPGGRITKRDLRAFLDGHGAGLEPELYGDAIQLSQKRKFLTRQMTESKQTTPHFYISMDVEAEPMRALRERLKGSGSRVTYTHMLIKAAALALARHPEVNATFRDDRIVQFVPINVAVAVSVEDELVAPVVKHCGGKTLDELAEATDALIERARERKLAPEDYSDGTFTISNLGMFGVDQFYAIITPPQATVLSVSRVRSEPVADGGEIRVGERMTLGLACDHRVLDGARAARFLAELKRVLENPEELLPGDGDGA